MYNFITDTFGKLFPVKSLIMSPWVPT
jgi:hypothetical protein